MDNSDRDGWAPEKKSANPGGEPIAPRVTAAAAAAGRNGSAAAGGGR